MAKGASIKFHSYEKTVPKLLELLNLKYELKKYDKVVLKPHLTGHEEDSTNAEFVEAVLSFCLENKNPITEVFIAEGADGYNTSDLFTAYGYDILAEKYNVTLVDLNNSETDEIQDDAFLKFSTIHYPKLLTESFVISLPPLKESEETGIVGSLATMLGAYPAKNYTGFFSRNKNKIRKWPIKYSIHDSLICKTPDFAIVDASENGSIFAGIPFEIDKQLARYLGIDWQKVSYLNLLNESVLQPQTPKAQ